MEAWSPKWECLKLRYWEVKQVLFPFLRDNQITWKVCLKGICAEGLRRGGGDTQKCGVGEGSLTFCPPLSEWELASEARVVILLSKSVPLYCLSWGDTLEGKYQSRLGYTLEIKWRIFHSWHHVDAQKVLDFGAFKILGFQIKDVLTDLSKGWGSCGHCSFSRPNNPKGKRERLSLPFTGMIRGKLSVSYN
jgi:hypothetical protein